MVLGVEIALLVIGIIALVRGKLSLSKRKVIVGSRARILGAIAVLPLPVAFMTGWASGLSTPPGPGRPDPDGPGRDHGNRHPAGLSGYALRPGRRVPQEAGAGGGPPTAVRPRSSASAGRARERRSRRAGLKGADSMTILSATVLLVLVMDRLGTCRCSWPC